MSKTLNDIITAVYDDLDLWAEKFVTRDEVIRHINKSQELAYNDIINLYEDYFLDYNYIPLNKNQYLYDLPKYIYANKIRRIFYLSNNNRYTIDRITDVNVTEAIFDNQLLPYRYMLINDRHNGMKIRFYPKPYENSKFYTAVVLANTLRNAINAHFSDTTMHTTNPDNHTIIDTEIVDRHTLIEVVEDMREKYTEHNNDALKTNSWYYHVGQLVDDPLNSTILQYNEAIIDLDNIVNALNDLLNAFNNHDVNSVAHSVGGLHQVDTSLTINSNDPVIKILYTRRVKDLVNDTDELDIPEFWDYVVTRTKLFVLEKDVGNPMYQLVYNDFITQKENLIRTLENRFNDDNNPIYIRSNPYRNQVAVGEIDIDAYEGMIL